MKRILLTILCFLSLQLGFSQHITFSIKMFWEDGEWYPAKDASGWIQDRGLGNYECYIKFKGFEYRHHFKGSDGKVLEENNPNGLVWFTSTWEEKISYREQPWLPEKVDYIKRQGCIALTPDAFNKGTKGDIEIILMQQDGDSNIRNIPCKGIYVTY